MMKISKPVLSNDFLLSPVQFTSLSTIVFKNIKNIYDGNEKISLEYEHSSKIEASSRDWIGIFPRGWSTLQQYVTFEWVSQSLPCGNNEKNKENGDLTRRTINFCLKYHMGAVNSNTFYQFVYVSKQIEVLGVSSYFRFDGTAANDPSLELECLVPVSSKLRSTSVSDIGILMANKISSSTSIDTRTLQTTSIHSLHNLEVDGKNWTKPSITLGVSDLKKPIFFSKKSTGTGDALDPYSSHSEPVFPMSFPMNQCKKCFHFKRGGEFLRSQQVLQSKVGPRSEEASEFNGQRRTLGHEYLSEDKLKIVMERNKILEDRAQEMKKEMERLQAESKRLKTSFYYTNKEKVAYEKFVKDFIKSLEKDSVVRVVNGNTEFLVKKVNYVGMEEHPRDKKTSKRERELKAVIGLQEITIRNLINSLQEKAKSVQELNQTVKLAQAFSAARNETAQEFGSDAEETLDETLEEVSSSDVASEYEFSLSKPSPPEEVTVEDTDAVLDGIRRATEMELKDIGISRSLGKSSSRESASELGFPSLSVRSYQSEVTQPKKPRLFDNVENCSSFPETPKVVQRKIMQPNPDFEGGNSDEKEPESYETEITSKFDSPKESNLIELSESDQQNCSKNSDIEDLGNSESYYDACEVFNPLPSTKDSDNPREAQEPSEGKEIAVFEKIEDEKEKKNFLVTAIIPHDLDVKPERTVDEWLKAERGDSDEKKQQASEKGKKFTCQLSIDFAAKVLQPSSERSHSSPIANENGVVLHNQTNHSLDLVCSNSQVQLKDDSQSLADKPVLSFKKSNKCLEIKITQVDQKEKSTKNYLQQKMVVKFDNDSQQEVESKSSKFEFNLAVTGLGEKAKLMNTDEVENDSEHKLPLNAYNNNNNTEMDASPRTVWNDASDDIAEVQSLEEVAQEEIQPQQTEEDVLEVKIESDVQEDEIKQEVAGDEEDKLIEVPEHVKEESVESNMNLYEDSLRYEKNLEFLQQKKEETMKEEISKNKPTAILIQNGQTKLALIRYQ